MPQEITKHDLKRLDDLAIQIADSPNILYTCSSCLPLGTKRRH